jgi:DNA-binding NarL/FixJ family response regulator
MLLAAGLSKAEITQRLFVSNAAVENPHQPDLRKTGAHDRAQAVRYA